MTCDGCRQCVNEDFMKNTMSLYKYFDGTPGHFTVTPDAALGWSVK